MSNKKDRPSSSSRHGRGEVAAPSLPLKKSVSSSKNSYISDNSTYQAGVDEMQTLLDGLIDEEFILKQAGVEDLSKIVHLQLVIDTSSQSVFDLPKLVPNLQHLELDNSIIITVRDLGVGLRNITYLSLAVCGLSDLDGIGVLTGLQELNLSNNYISDVTPLAMHENIRNLNLSGNNVSEISIADALSSCPKLRSLFLSRNPINKARNYRLIIASLIGTLEMLDGTPVDAAAAACKVTNGMILEAAEEMRAVEEEMDDEMRLENEIMDIDHFTTATTGAVSRGGAMNSPMRKQTLGNFVNSNNSAETVAAGSELFPDTGSDLTHGSGVVLAGSMAAAVRRRRQLLSAGSSEGSSLPSSRGSSRPDTGYSNCDDLPLSASVAAETTTTTATSVLSAAGARKYDSEVFESTLDILDAALVDRSSRGRVEGGDVNCFREGDVTEAMSGDSVLFTEKYPQRPLTATTTASELRLTSLEGDLQLPFADNFMSFESERSAGSSSNSAKNCRNSAASPLHSDSSRPRSSGGGAAAATAALSSSSPRVSSVRASSGGGERHSVAAFSPRPGMPPRSSSNNGSSHSIEKHTPSHAASTATANKRRQRDDSHDDSTGATGSKLSAPSPRQHNSSRPQSAVQKPPRSSVVASSFSAPFKVAMDKEDTDQCFSSTTAASVAAMEVDADLTSIDGIAAMKGGGMRGGVPSQTAASVSNAIASDAAAICASSSNNSSSDIINSTPRKNIIATSDVATSDSTSDSTFPYSRQQQQQQRSFESDEDESDVEEVAITHADRHRLMAASALTNRADSTTASIKHRRNILMQLKETSTSSSTSATVVNAVNAAAAAEYKEESTDPDSESTTLRDAPFVISRTSRCSSSSAKNNSNNRAINNSICDTIESTEELTAAVLKAKPAHLTNSSRAGMSLGFNLAGSLAAIDKWVHDMSSDEEDDDSDNCSDEDDEDEDGAPLALPARGGFSIAAALANTLGSGDGYQQLPAATAVSSTYAAAAVDAMNMSKDSASEVSSTYSTSKASISSQARKNKILYRDVIMGMCSSGSKTAHHRSDVSSADSSDSEPFFEIDGEGNTTAFSDNEDIDNTIGNGNGNTAVGGNRTKAAKTTTAVAAAAVTSPSRESGGGLEGGHWTSSPRKRPDYKSISILKERRGIPVRAKTPLQYQHASTSYQSHAAATTTATDPAATDAAAADLFRGAVDEDYELQMDDEETAVAGKHQQATATRRSNLSLNSKMPVSKQQINSSAATTATATVAAAKEEEAGTERRRRRKQKQVVPGLDSNTGNTAANATTTTTTSSATADSGTVATDGSSPPRFTADDTVVLNSTTTTAPASTNNSQLQHQQQLQQKDSSSGSGRANRLTDAELIELLRQPPKSTLVLRTRSSFQDFFRGITSKRMRALLLQAYADLPDGPERDSKIEKRMEILNEVVI